MAAIPPPARVNIGGFLWEVHDGTTACEMSYPIEHVRACGGDPRKCASISVSTGFYRKVETPTRKKFELPKTEAGKRLRSFLMRIYGLGKQMPPRGELD